MSVTLGPGGSTVAADASPGSDDPHVVTAGPLPPDAVAGFRLSLMDIVDRAHGIVVVDLSETDYLDARAAAVLVGAARRLAARRGRLLLTGAGHQARKMLALHGLLQHLWVVAI
jgi:anti-anti-sigma factor